MLRLLVIDSSDNFREVPGIGDVRGLTALPITDEPMPWETASPGMLIYFVQKLATNRMEANRTSVRSSATHERVSELVTE